MHFDSLDELKHGFSPAQKKPSHKRSSIEPLTTNEIQIQLAADQWCLVHTLARQDLLRRVQSMA